ncbi:hypothetical protein [Alloactinosynnema sp. L-07]|uniref:hypothetical protein n=1 Tax=Alloactinosynnema sp. L-07 TaxID=1653480 RepID=UPI00065EFBA7|nr:hypothetical protein [Alloactinosynnema sp. L-07]CRK57169.1 hypothetical protein [Alloactinosynnema sp. L-07]
MTTPKENGGTAEARSQRSQLGTWLTGVLAIVANVVSVVQAATSSRVVVPLITGVLAVVGGCVWSWRLLRRGSGTRVRNRIVALCLAIMLIVAGIVALVAAWYWRTPPQRQVDAAQPANTRPFTGTIAIRYPGSGWTLASGDDLGGEVTEWSSGYQIWMSARPESGSTELVQGPCAVTGTSFVCSDVQLPGPSGTREFIRLAVVTDAEAKRLGDTAALPFDSPAQAQTQIYKG